MDQFKQTITLSNLKQLFEKSEDIIFQELTFNETKIHIINCDAMVDQQLLYTVVLPKLENFFMQSQNGTVDYSKILQLPIPNIKPVTNKNDLITYVYNGFLLIFIEQSQQLFSCNIARKPNRNPEDTNLEALVKGPRDNFIEDISVNIALIRKRFPSNSLCVEKMEIGKRTKTAVAILYVDDIVNKDILTELKKQLAKIDTDMILSADSLMEFINRKNWILPATHYTARPDFAIQSLIRGRFLIMVDGASYAVMTPVNLFYLLKSAEDFENPIIFSSFERILRLLGVVIGATLPAFWLALTLFHQNQLPLQLLATVVIANRGLPLPALIEMLVLIILFEMFREAGLRLPTVIGGTFSVVGGLIIGDAAIRSGITSPAMVVIIAVSIVSSYTIVNQSLVTMISILRIVFILVTAVFGLFGYLMCIYIVIIYISNMRVFGVPYLNIFADFSWQSTIKTLLRTPKDQYSHRPKMLDPQDETRTNEGEK